MDVAGWSLEQRSEGPRWKMLASVSLHYQSLSFIQDNYGPSVCLEVGRQGVRFPPTPNGGVTLGLCTMCAVISRSAGL